MPSTEDLPPELLAAVFLEVVVSLFYSISPTATSFYSWIPSITHVCQRWRAVALQTPQLWSYILFARPDPRIGVCIERSAGTPVNMVIHDSPPTTSQEALDIFMTIGAESPRIRHLVVSGPWLRLRWPFPPAPLLVVISVNYAGFSSSYATEANDLPAVLRKPLPHLREFYWRVWVFGSSLKDLICPNLRVLDIAFDPRWGALSWTQWLLFLKAVPLLEELVLTSLDSSHVIGPADAPMSPVALPHLLRLSLTLHSPPRDSLSQTVAESYLLQHLVLPAQTRLEFVVTQLRSSERAIVHLIEAIQSQLLAIARHGGVQKSSPALILLHVVPHALEIQVKNQLPQPSNLCEYTEWLDRRVIHAADFRLTLHQTQYPGENTSLLFRRICELLSRAYVLSNLQTLLLLDGLSSRYPNSFVPQLTVLQHVAFAEMMGLETLVLHSRQPEWLVTKLLLEPIQRQSLSSNGGQAGHVAACSPSDSDATDTALLFPSLKLISLTTSPARRHAHIVSPDTLPSLSERLARRGLERLHVCAGLEPGSPESPFELGTQDPVPCEGQTYNLPQY
ncbi:hypothetical protein NM688_g6716 [Phlebia brevispora]|uniref:Uncharacterized protein n=1 Tax=Phlebia brevispora TaxID=194682 RepID=A0ACC1SD57_9APHY|nr:hypothetical protein NM688_g6716 [Phlebia brevispora]